MRGDGLVQREASAALAERSLARLRAGFAKVLEVEQATGDIDYRDTLIHLAPFVDCSRRLGHDPAVAQRSEAATAPEWLRETFEALLARGEFALEDYGWELIGPSEDPRYQWLP